MKRKYLVGLVLFIWGVALAAWPVNAAYDGSSDTVNAANIQSMGYHAFMTAGKVYKFEFSDGTTAYFMRLPGLSSIKFQQVSEAEYNANPGADPVTGTGYGGSGGGNNSMEDFAMQNMAELLSQFPPNSIIVYGEGGQGVVTCEPACF